MNCMLTCTLYIKRIRSSSTPPHTNFCLLGGCASRMRHPQNKVPNLMEFKNLLNISPRLASSLMSMLAHLNTFTNSFPYFVFSLLLELMLFASFPSMVKVYSPSHFLHNPSMEVHSSLSPKFFTTLCILFIYGYTSK